MIAFRRERTPDRATAEKQVAALNEVLDTLERDFGTWRVAWGEIIRLQRLDESKSEKFQDGRSSFAVAGVNGNDGAVFTFYAARRQGQKRRYGVAGGSYVSVVEFGPRVRALVSSHLWGKRPPRRVVTTLIKPSSTRVGNLNRRG